MEQQSLHFQALPITVEPRGDEEDNPFQATAELQLLGESKDVLDEISLIKSVTNEQAAVLAKFADNTWAYDKKAGGARVPIDSVQRKRQNLFLKRRPAALRSVVNSINVKAKDAYNAISNVLDLKQKQANIFEARSATKMVRESEKSSETLMLVGIATIDFARSWLTWSQFTIVTIIFV